MLWQATIAACSRVRSLSARYSNSKPTRQVESVNPVHVSTVVGSVRWAYSICHNSRALAAAINVYAGEELGFANV